MTYRDDERALLDRQNALERDLHDVKVVLQERRAKRSLTILDSVRIAAPCRREWEAMHGDRRVRFCGSCAKNVYNLSALTSREAQALLLEKEGSTCVRLYRRKDGTVLTTDCPVGVDARRSRNRVAGIVAAASATLAAASIAALRSQTSVPPYANFAHYSRTTVDASPAYVGWSQGELSFAPNPDGTYPTAEELFQKEYDFAMKRAKR